MKLGRGNWGRTGRPPLPVAPRFWARTAKGDGCWPWTAAKDRDGYGVMRVLGRQVKAHRVSWELHRGAIPDGLLVLHHCDNPRCVRPDHLFLGTNADNVADMLRKGRCNPARGDRNGARTKPRARFATRPPTRLTAVQIAAVLERRGENQVVIAAAFGVHPSTVSRVLSGARRRRS